MHHRAGLASFTDGSAPEFALTRGLAGDGRAQRAAFAKAVLSRPPAHTPGDTFEYSNAGYGVAGAIAERAGLTPDEVRLVADRLEADEDAALDDRDHELGEEPSRTRTAHKQGKRDRATGRAGRPQNESSQARFLRRSH